MTSPQSQNSPPDGGRGEHKTRDKLNQILRWIAFSAALPLIPLSFPFLLAASSGFATKLFMEMLNDVFLVVSMLVASVLGEHIGLSSRRSNIQVGIGAVGAAIFFFSATVYGMNYQQEGSSGRVIEGVMIYGGVTCYLLTIIIGIAAILVAE